MSNTEITLSLFQRLNSPFPYSDYQYDSFNDRCYVSGQAITERMNEALGVGFWKYQGSFDTEKIIHDANGKNTRVKIYMEFSFYNIDLQQWITFIDAGSEQIKPGMNEGDATKSAITDGMKKCASRIGVASDLYKGLITWDKQQQCIQVPSSYLAYYEQQNINLPALPLLSTASSPTTKSTKKNALTTKLRQKPSTHHTQMKTIWRSLAGNLDGFEEWFEKKKQEQHTEQQMLQLLNRKLSQKKTTTIA